MDLLGGAGAFHEHWDNTWGQGTGAYRFGFVVGVIVLILVFVALGEGASTAATKKKNQATEEGNKNQAEKKGLDSSIS